MDRLAKTCLGGLISLPLIVGTIALGFLSTPPSISCHSVDKQAAVSTRLHCAQQRAERQTSESLTAAIDLLGDVPADDPYYEQSKRVVERWAIELLAKAEAEFQAGNLDKAVEIARSLPEETKIKAWKSTWEKGEAVMKAALTQVEKREWRQAFQTADQLRQLGNEYWATEQYDSLTRQIQSDREMRDWNFRNPVEPQKKRKEPEFIPPQLPEVAQSTRPERSPENDATIFRSVSAATEFPKLQPVSKPQPSPEAEIAPEPPIETSEPIPETSPEPVQDTTERDRT